MWSGRASIVTLVILHNREHEAWLDAPQNKGKQFMPHDPAKLLVSVAAPAPPVRSAPLVRGHLFAQNVHMSRDYLHKIERAAFPLRVEDQCDIGCIHVLRAAGMLEAAVTPSSEAGKDFELAIVHRITTKGRDELERMRRQGGPTAD